MVARPGRLQSALTAGELDPSLHDRTQLKYFSTGAARMENVEIIPQGGFKVKAGTHHLGALSASSSLIVPFTASDGQSYDLVFNYGGFEVWGPGSKLQTISAPLIEASLVSEMTHAQQLDTLLLFHNDLKPQRIAHRSASNWTIEDAPISNIFNFDYGGPVGGGSYTNGIAAQWELDFQGLTASTATAPASTFTLTANGQTSAVITFGGSVTALAVDMQAQLSTLSSMDNVTAVLKPATTDTVRVSFDLDAAFSLPTTLTATIIAQNGVTTATITKVQEYSEGVQPAIYDIVFADLLQVQTSGGSVFELTVSQQKTESIPFLSNYTSLAALVQSAISNLPNVFPGITVTVASGKLLITFNGVGNEGDGWAVSGQTVNKVDAAILAYRKTPGVPPGEPVMSEDRGWPACGVFHQQRLGLGGFKSLPNAYGWSLSRNYYEFDIRYSGANGPHLVPMDIAGGERISRMIDGRNLQIFTSSAEYWLAERTISALDAPNWVQSSSNGLAPGAPLVQVSGYTVYPHKDGSSLSEFRYTDIEGNYVSQEISLLASHLVGNVSHLAIKKASADNRTNLLGLINDDGSARLITLLREQEITAFSRFVTDGIPKAVAVNGRNEMRWIIERNGTRRLEQSNPSLLLDGAILFDREIAADTVSGLGSLEGKTVWAVADNSVYGPFTVVEGVVTLPVAALSGYVGLWSPPIVTLLPPPRDIAPNTVLRRKARIHSVQLSVLDTTSIAIGLEGQPLNDVDLYRYGLQADVAELQTGFTGILTVRGLVGFRDEPRLTISQLRPGKMTVRSVTVEAAL